MSYTLQIIPFYLCATCKKTILNKTIEYLINHRAAHDFPVERERQLWEERLARAKRSPKRVRKISIQKKTRSKKGKRANKLRAALKRENLLASENAALRKKLSLEIKAIFPPRQMDPFLASRMWRDLRYRVITLYGRTCMCCGTTSGEMRVDHIKPKSRYPELALSFDNMQVLCKACNFGKGVHDETDWRPHSIAAQRQPHPHRIPASHEPRHEDALDQAPPMVCDSRPGGCSPAPGIQAKASHALALGSDPSGEALTQDAGL